MQWWEKALDTATGVFDKVIDYESAKSEADVIRTTSLVGTAQAAEPVPASGSNFFASIPPYLLYGALAVGAILLLRR